jgi:hypothetical protein
MRILAGLTDQGRRGDYRGIAGPARVSLVDVERIVVANRKREVANRCASELLARGVADLAPDPSPKLLCQKRAD